MVQLRALIQPFEGDVYCHVPIGSSIPVNDFRFAGRGSGNRWNAPGQRTLYLAHDHAAALAEWARHAAKSYNPDLDPPVQRHMYRLSVAFPAVLDLRDRQVWEALGGVITEPADFLDVTRCRTMADFARNMTNAVAIHVPSVAFLDDLARGNLVVFLDKLDDDQGFIHGIADCGVVGYHPNAVSSTTAS